MTVRTLILALALLVLPYFAEHGYGNGWIADAQPQCDPAEERDRPLHVRHRHVSDRQAYGSCWLITAGRERLIFPILSPIVKPICWLKLRHRNQSNCIIVNGLESLVNQAILMAIPAHEIDDDMKYSK